MRALDRQCLLPDPHRQLAAVTFHRHVYRNHAAVTNGLRTSGEEFEWEQDWITGRYESMRPEFLTLLGIGRERVGSRHETRPTAGVRFRLWPGADWNTSGTCATPHATTTSLAPRGCLAR